MTSVDDINSLESEAGIIASLIHKPVSSSIPNIYYPTFYK